MGLKKIIRKIIKRFFGIDGISLFIKKQKKKIMQKVYTKKYTADDLVVKMCQMGMQNGSVVFIHSSMTEFYNYKGTGEELIDKIINVIGKEGTLMMPAYPAKKTNLYKIASETDEVVFDVNKTSSGAGYLTEVFRKYPEVKRSVNLQHSVCARGKLAEYFTNEHHLSETAWDRFSPYYKLGHTQALIFSLGLEPYLRNVTMIHCTEDTFRNTYTYFASFFSKSIRYKYLDQFNNYGYQEMLVPEKGGVRSSKVIKKYFDKAKFKKAKLSNLNIEVVESLYMYKRCIELTEEGVCIYSFPKYLKYRINNKFIRIDEGEK